MKIFSIKDAKAEGFNTPWTAPTFGLAERQFKELAQDSQSTVSKHTEDFTLWYIGEFDMQSGTIAPVEPQMVCNAI